MCPEAGVCRGSALNENLESLQADWERKTISHCDFIPLLEIFPKHSWNSSVLASPATEKCAFVLSHGFLLIFTLRFRQLVDLELSSFLPFRAWFGSEYLGEPFPSLIILIVSVIVLYEIQSVLCVL